MTMLTALRSFASGLRRSWPLRLEVDGQWHSFTDEKFFSGYLAERIDVPASRIEELAALDGRAVQREIRHTRRSHKNAVDILVRALETKSRLRYLWGLLDVSKVPDELSWPAILFAVGSAENVAESALRMALTHYVSYLEARREVLESLVRESRGMGRSGPRAVVPGGLRDRERGARSNPAKSYTSRRHKMYARLPRRRAVNVDLNQRSQVALYLARNRFTLGVAEGKLLLMEQGGINYPLKVGRNLVGRSGQCDIQVSGNHPDLSRQHLLIELTEDFHVRLTDLSTRGTYLPPELLERMDSGTTSRHVH
jgi:hypothetical protein